MNSFSSLNFKVINVCMMARFVVWHFDISENDVTNLKRQLHENMHAVNMHACPRYA